MNKLAYLLIACLLFAAPALAKTRAQQSESQSSTQSGTAAAGASERELSAVASSDNSDPVKTLDKLLQTPVDKTLQGHAESDEGATIDEGKQTGSGSLKGAAEAAAETKLRSRDAMMAPAPKAVLKGFATAGGGQLKAAQDPDQNDQEIMLEWDRWRNRFLRAVQQQVQVNMNNPDWDNLPKPRFNPVTGMLMPRFPLGTEAWFYVEVTPDRHIKHVEITQSSGYKDYDRAVLNGIRVLDGTSILKYPSGSRRELVSQEAGVRTSNAGGYEYQHFGDIERYRSRN